MAHKVLQSLIAAAAAVLPVVNGQLAGSVTSESHPQLTTWKCTTGGGCVQQNTAVVLDWNYRWIHTSNGYTSCIGSGGVDSGLCPDQAACGKNCVVEGADYGNNGISTSGSSLTLRQFVKGSDGKTNSVSPRVYLLDSDNNYVLMKLLGQELSFDVDLSTLPCGENGALYFSEMDKTGGRSGSNAGATYGGGYCDAQCPVQNWFNGVVNPNKKGYCCAEMDILEGNSRAQVFTPHPCAGGKCDSWGCGFNPYAAGNKGYYGPGSGYTLDTSKPFTVITRFITNDGTTGGSLDRITRYYVQNGKKVPSAVSGGDSIFASSCSTAGAYGGLAGMGQALGRGMVLALSIWNDAAGNMNWLDSGAQGPCSSDEGNPSNILANRPDTHVVFSNIRWGDIGSTVQIPGEGGGNPVSTSTNTKPATTTKTATKTTTKTPTTTTAQAGATQTPWGQCGGDGYSGPKACPPSYSCEYVNTWYWQCMANQSLYGRCGGEGWTGPRVCAAPYTCQYKNQWYSQCL